MAKNKEIIRTRGFSIANMKDDYDEASQTLFEAISGQTPDVDFDAFDLELRRLVMRFGGAPSSMSPYTQQYPAFASLIESADEKVEAVYNEAADILILSHAEYKRGHHRDARLLYQTALKHEDMLPLIEALTMNNANSKIGIRAEAESDDSEDWNDPNDDEVNSEDDDTPQVALNDDEDDQSDNLDDSSDDEEVDSEETDETTDTTSKSTEKPAKNKSDEDTDETTKVDTNLPMGGTTSVKDNILKIAAANKMSQNGTKESLFKARKIAV